MTSRDSSVSVEAAFRDAESITTPNYYEHDDNQGEVLLNVLFKHLANIFQLLGSM